ncbi:CHAT domain-containing protein [Actinokineospora fastidiosa]|uniref:CHAT domain-containing protein n=1 Tax=Actinokineospora fastidiosa TaxID=1816 RepID=A0A918LIM7_9PSEU|nr:CHAT domain-containing protein [Actinokineospora fastidiosa]GGS54829.1 hypothetical protein GCM10010171_57470 [Actinokineospora fastidiosa]
MRAERDMYVFQGTVENFRVDNRANGERSSAEADPLRVFFVGASPFDIDLDRIRADREFRAIERVARPGRLVVANRPAAGVDDLSDLLRERHDVLHLSCHMRGAEFLFEDAEGETHAVAADAVAQRLRTYRDHGGLGLDGIVLSCCGSAEVAELFAGLAATVVAWRGDLDDDCAIAFAGCFYRALISEPRPALGSAARIASVEAGGLDRHCREIGNQLVVLGV